MKKFSIAFSRHICGRVRIKGGSITRIPASFEEINQYVSHVHKATIRIRPNRVTAVLDIGGRQITGGGSTFEELIAYINSRQASCREYLRTERMRKKTEKADSRCTGISTGEGRLDQP